MPALYFVFLSNIQRKKFASKKEKANSLYKYRRILDYALKNYFSGTQFPPPAINFVFFSFFILKRKEK